MMKTLDDVTCPDCRRTLSYVGCVEKSNKDKVYEYECRACGFSKDVIVKKGDKK